MKKTICDLWNGNTLPICNQLENTQADSNLLAGIEQCHNELYGNLDDRAKELLKTLENYHSELLVSECEKAFTQVFSIATKLLSEAWT